ncbi:MAG: phosphoadenylyl-sulfate reductase [Chloroflexota bacterium]|nr:phosphoadenylyl-sulfate reductase [Chloroflexota bacterium]
MSGPVVTANRLDLQQLNQRFSSAPAESVLQWVDQTFAPDVALACSFGGLAGMVLVDMAARLSLRFEIFYLDTDLLFPQTYALVERVKERYGLQPVAYSPDLSLSAQAARYGDELWRWDPDRCCALRKVEPNRRALEGKRAWVTGIRRDQTPSRWSKPLVEWDTRFELVKVNPLAAWSEAEVREYIRRYDVPYNPLLDRGLPSIGCLPCTRAVQPGEDPRAGRWSGFEKTECGLHFESGVQGPGSRVPSLGPAGERLVSIGVGSVRESAGLPVKTARA